MYVWLRTAFVRSIGVLPVFDVCVCVCVFRVRTSFGFPYDVCENLGFFPLVCGCFEQGNSVKACFTYHVEKASITELQNITACVRDGVIGVVVFSERKTLMPDTRKKGEKQPTGIIFQKKFCLKGEYD